ncbi:hypothetical protein N6B72_05015 [Chryseobacterium soli]|uniref:hypothetical protein n=1 Tax=Chryseobacterium soli TaxID=445961 RepID=UPI0029554D8A|nr:hypothetical protein [Chryseobacterium soli]MDV7696277.1 hypothetical protein [Chryseobacterium soli]
MEELEQKVLDIVKDKHTRTGGNNGNGFGDFDEVLKMSIEDRNAFIQRMADKNIIVIREGANQRMIMLPKKI